MKTRCQDSSRRDCEQRGCIKPPPGMPTWGWRRSRSGGSRIQRGWPAVRTFSHAGDEAITAFWDRFDVLRRRAAFPEELAKNRNVECEIVVFYKCLWPDLL